jgi:hypothetical protein
MNIYGHINVKCDIGILLAVTKDKRDLLGGDSCPEKTVNKIASAAGFPHGAEDVGGFLGEVRLAIVVNDDFGGPAIATMNKGAKIEGEGRSGMERYSSWGWPSVSGSASANGAKPPQVDERSP